jgi:hypothetical protein
VALAALAGPPGARAALDVSTSRAVNQSCDRQPLDGDGVATRSLTAPRTGWITAWLDAPGAGDWDLAVFDADNGRLVAASTAFGSSEVASGIASKGEQLRLQACRRSGTSERASLDVDWDAMSTAKVPTLSMVRVSTPNAPRKKELDGLGLDLTEHGGKGFVEVVLHDAADARKLREHKFIYTTQIADLAAQDRRDSAANSRYARRVSASSLPSGRTTYRRLNNYTDEMKKLATDNPGLVKPLTLPFKTLIGRTVQGIEITTDVNARDGKPVFLQLGVHHAREWPSSEHAMEWAYELINGYKRGDARARRLVETTRTIVVPVVNPDGFNTSREAGEAAGAGGGRGGPDETPNVALPYEYQRKNCRVNNPDGADPERGDCTQVGQPNVGLSQFGVDPNRNYGSFWGGPGASADGGPPGGDYAQDYRGSGPFSEAESRNVRDLVSHRQVTTLITNHTFSGLVLRPPGIQTQGDPPDEPAYKALGDSMAAENGYTSEKGFQLYDTTGTTEDWSYYVTGGFGFTFEIGPTNFHPPYADVVAEYEGTTTAADQGHDGKGNREAYFKAQENTADASKHSTITGAGPSGGVLRLRKAFKTSTSKVIDADGVEGSARLFDDVLDTVMDVPDDGKFSWGINPSTRPVVAKQKGRNPTGTPSPPMEFNGNAPAAPCGAATPNPACYSDVPFTVPTGAGVDNAKATVEVTWGSPASDYDITVYKDTDGDGTSDGEPDSAAVGSSAQGTTNEESTTFGEPAETIAGKKYVVRVLNFAGAEPFNVQISFGGPDPIQPAQVESWDLTCEVPDGHVVTREKLTIGRGQSKKLDLGACVAQLCAKATTFRIRGKSVANASLGRTRKGQRKRLGGRLLSKRGGLDKYCLPGGGTMRIGYSTTALRRKLSRKERRRVKNRAILVVSSSKKHKVKGVKVGTTTKTMRRRLKRERGVRVGKNVWWLVKGKKAQVAFKTRGGKVREIGLVDSRLTRTKRGAKRMLRTWELPRKR